MANPFVHVEYSADDMAAAKKFYKSLFGWKLKEAPGMGGWVGIDVGGGVGGGMGPKQMPDQPTTWTAYVAVDSVKKTIEKARAAGALIIVDYMPVGTMGALGIFVDPQGATLGVWEEAKKPKAAPKKAAAKKPAAKKAAPKKAAKKPAAKKAAKKKK
jgi:predicted enzyme related to lactoylglutathione lyase